MDSVRFELTWNQINLSTVYQTEGIQIHIIWWTYLDLNQDYYLIRVACLNRSTICPFLVTLLDVVSDIDKQFCRLATSYIYQRPIFIFRITAFWHTPKDLNLDPTGLESVIFH